MSPLSTNLPLNKAIFLTLTGTGNFGFPFLFSSGGATMAVVLVLVSYNEPDCPNSAKQ